MIKDYEGGKPVIVIAGESGMSHSTIATILKNKNKVTSCYRIRFIDGNETNKNSKRAYIRYRETSNDLDSRPDTEAYISQHHDDHGQSKMFVTLTILLALSSLKDSKMNHHSLHNVKK